MNPTTKTVARKTAGFTLLELTVAAGLMTIILVMLYTIFSSAGGIFAAADSRIEIFQTARTAIETIQRDLAGAVVDNNGNIFRGWNRAYTYSNTYDVPAVPTVTSLTDTDPFNLLLCDTSNSGGYSHGGYQNLQVYCQPDMVWFRTTSEWSNFGVPTEVIFRLGRGFILEKGISNQLTEVDIMTLSAADRAALIESRFQFTPIGFRIREFQLRYYQVDGWNQSADLRVTLSGNRFTHWIDFWPPASGQAYDLADTTTTATNYSWAFDNAAARRARIPAAMQVTLRIGDSSDREWTDYYSAYILDGLDQPLPNANYLGARVSGGSPVDGIKQMDTSADEVGMVFRYVVFIPTYLKALGLRRGDL